MQGPSPHLKLEMLKGAWSDARWHSLNPGQADDVELLKRHVWATAAQASVMPAVTVLELTLRNALLTRSTELLAQTGWKSRDLDVWLDATPSLLRERDQKEVDEAKSRLRKKHRGKLTVGRLVAELDLGFWTGLFDSYYDHGSGAGARLWPWLVKKAFPGAPKGMQTRGDLSSHFHRLRELRNGVVHHKHFWKHDGLLNVFDAFAHTVGWMNRSAQIALVTSSREWVLLLQERGHDYFEPLSTSLLPPALRPAVPEAELLQSSLDRSELELDLSRDDLPF